MPPRANVTAPQEPPRRRRRKPKSERYEDVLSAAAEVFSDRGYRASTIHDVASKLDMTGAALYHYVDGKEDLLVAICQRAGDRLHEAAKEVMAMDVSPEEKLRTFFHRHLELIEGDRAIFSILIQERSELPADRVEELLKGERAYLNTVRMLLAQFEPQMLSGLDANLCALSMVGMLNWTIRWYRPDGRYRLQDVADEFFRIFALGIFSSPGLRRRARSNRPAAPAANGRR